MSEGAKYWFWPSASYSSRFTSFCTLIFLCFLRKWSLGHFNHPYIFMISDPKPLSYVLSLEVSIEKVFFSDRTWPTQKLFCRAAEWSLPPWLVCLSDNSIFFVWMQTSRHILRIDDHKNVKVVKMTAKSFSAEMKKQWQKSSRRWVNF